MLGIRTRACSLATARSVMAATYARARLCIRWRSVSFPRRARRSPSLTGRAGAGGLGLVSARRPPAPAMDDVGLLLALPLGRRTGRGLLGQPVSERDGADRVVVVRDRERVTSGAVVLRWDAEEAGAQALVDRREQDQQAGHGGVHVPERHRPACLVEVGPALVRLC